MAVGAPVLERRPATEERVSRIYNANYNLTDEEHNARIKQNYARLINPENSIAEALDVAPVTEVEAAPAVSEPQAAFAQPVYVESARADADIFHAHSEINQRLAQQRQIIAEQSSEEDESEDLRPTPTTIQYKTSALKETVEEGKIANISVDKPTGLSKKEKIVISAIVGAIILMLVLIIVNAVVLSNISSNISYLQSSLTTVKGSYEGVKDQIGINTLTEDQVAALAEKLGWVKG